MRAIPLVFFALLLPGFGAGLSFEKTLKEVTATPDARTVTVDFGFENSSAEDVRILRYDAACSCMSVQVQGGKLHYAPGEKGVIRAVFDMGNFSGTVDKAVQVWQTGDPDDAPSIQLTTRVTIPVLVEVEPKTLKWDLDAKADPQTITIRMNHDEPIRVTEISCGNPNFKVELKTLEDGKHYELQVTPQGTGTAGMGVIHIQTDCAISRQASQRAFTVIRKPLPGSAGS